MSATENLSLLLADCRQALFDAIKADDGASNSTRYECGRAIALMGKAMDQEKLFTEALAPFAKAAERGGEGYSNLMDLGAGPAVVGLTLGDCRRARAAIAMATAA